MTLLDLLTLISYLALNIDIVLQTIRIYRTKSSKDLSLTGMIIRLVAIIVILVKFISLESLPLIIGQGWIAVTFIFYFILAIYYYRHTKKTRYKK